MTRADEIHTTLSLSAYLGLSLPLAQVNYYQAQPDVTMGLEAHFWEHSPDQLREIR